MPPRSPALLPGDRAPVHTLGRPARLVCFLRPLSCPAARAGLDRLRDLDGVVVITPDRSGVDTDLPVLEDRDGALARAWHIGRDRRFLCTLRGLRAHPLAATLRVMRHGDALMSCFVLDGDRVVAAQHACHVADLPALS